LKLELFQHAKLVLSVEPVGNVVSGDFTFLPVRIAKGCTLKAESFDDLFFECLKSQKTHEKAYFKAEEIHEQYFGTTKYSSYESFQSSKSQRLKK